ncbi:endonuclease VII domain-containing protein [Streptomyces sp. NRRL S-920]|uniref:endonuclease VII domain-containing protein n=1 Tax=Streptomyces sp. NRRL S-920 TaxID=1463921 RepID=UPI000B075B6B|nr:endonuclease VII domain-containing protein [Streptomyces sp. NRRL S-920]
MKKRRKETAHELAVQNTYGLAPGDYDKLYRLQGGRCAICRRATGATRRLSVDHDHASGAVRGLLCRPCNSMLGHARDDIEFFQRAIAYLILPPACRLKGSET